MSSRLVTVPPPRPHKKKVDPFRYGWRDVQVIGPDGKQRFQRVPLTLDDVLHPQEGDVIAENNIHEEDRCNLSGVFKSRKARLKNGLILSDCLIDWGVKGVANHAPDITVFERLRTPPPTQFGVFDRGRHKGRCRLALELVSPHTRVNDVTHKFAEYQKVGVELYVIVDQKVEGGPRELLAYRLGDDGFETVPLDENSRLLIEPLGLLLGLEDNRVVCWDATSGDKLGDYTQEHQGRLEKEKLVRKKEKLIREKDERIRELEEQIRLLNEKK